MLLDCFLLLGQVQLCWTEGEAARVVVHIVILISKIATTMKTQANNNKYTEYTHTHPHMYMHKTTKRV